MPKKKAFYAISRGRCGPAVVMSWDECKRQVLGFGGSRYKSFSTQAEALRFAGLDGGGGGSNAGSSGSTAAAAPALAQKRKRSPPTTPATANYSTTAAKQAARPGGGDSSRGTHSLAGFPGFDGDDWVMASATGSNGRGPATTAAAWTAAQSSSSSAASSSSSSSVVYTDGACQGNGKASARAGVGVFFGPGDPRNVAVPLRGPVQTNQRAELTAVLLALRAIRDHPEAFQAPPPTGDDPDAAAVVADTDATAAAAMRGVVGCGRAVPRTPHTVVIKSDSTYSVKGWTSWLAGWKRGGWKNSKGMPVANQDLWRQVDTLKAELARLEPGLAVQLEWVRGHDGDPGNEAADRLAVAGISAPAAEAEAVEANASGDSTCSRGE